jgi:hypothetical protein
MINLTACVKGQKLRLRDGRIVIYVGLALSHPYPHIAIYWEGENLLYTYTDSGMYNTDHKSHSCDVIEILPLKTTEPTSHPSVAWWDSCPWITDRKPTKEDGKPTGWVVTKVIGSSDLITTSWSKIEVGHAWIHRRDWQPPALTDKEQAMELINNHEDGWRPTPEQWHIIRKGLA